MSYIDPVMGYSLEYLSELAVKNILERGTEFPVHLSGDAEPLERPCVQVTVTGVQEVIAPGSGVFLHELQVVLSHSASEEPDEAQTSGLQEQLAQDWATLRAAMFGDSVEPMRDLAERLTDAVPLPYRVLGVTCPPELPTAVDPATHTFSRGLVLQLRVTAG